MYYIFHGSDEFSARETLDKLKARLGDPAMVDLNTTELEGASLTLSELTHHASAIPFLAPKRVVIVHNYLSRFDRTGQSKAEAEPLTALADLLDHLPETTNLVFMETVELKKSNPILKKAQKLDKAVYLFDTPKNLAGWVEKRVAQKNGQIERQAANALAHAVGDDMRRLDNEIEKLTLYINQERAISLADVELLCPYTADSESFAMANAIGRRDADAALSELHKRLAEGQHPLAIMAGIATQFRGLLEVKSLADEGLTPQEIADHKNWRSDYAVRRRLQEGRNFSTERLVQIFNILLEADLTVKTGQIEEQLLLDTLVTRLCGVRD